MSSAAKSLIARRTERLCAEIATKDAEIARLREALEEITRKPGTAPWDVDEAIDVITAIHEVAERALSPIPDPAGGMPVEVET